MKNQREHVSVVPHRSALVGFYLVGFAFSILCTVSAYILVAWHLLPQGVLIATILELALLQCAVQMVCFLHLGLEKHSHLKLLVFGFALLIVAILIAGSLWIMHNLNEHMVMAPSQMELYMRHEGGF